MKKIMRNLAFWVLLAIAGGIAVGYFMPAIAMKLDVLSKYFIEIIKFFVGPIIFLTLVVGISGMGDLKKVGRVGLKSLIYFEIIALISLGMGIFFADFLQPGKLDIHSLKSSGDISRYTTSGAAESVHLWSLIKSNFTLQVLIFSIIVGVVVNKLSSKGKIVGYLKQAETVVFRLLKWVMYLAPFAAFGGIAFAVGKYGLATLLPLGKLIGSVYFTMLVFVFLVIGTLLHFYCRISIVKFLKYIKHELLIVWSTSSSESGLPTLVKKLEAMGCEKSIVGLVVPTGYSFNLDGTAIYLSMSVIFIAQLYNVHLTGAEMFSIMMILMVTSKGAAGVTGSGFIVLASTLTAIHKIPLEGLTYLIGIDKFLSEARALTNIIGNGAATIIIAKNEKALDENLLHKTLV